MKPYQIEEIDRIKNRDDLSEEKKAYLIKLISMTQEERVAYSKKQRDLRRSLTYSISISGDELESFMFAASLNRRMLDRGLEHGTFKKAFEMIEKKCAEIFHEEWDKVK